MKKIFLILMILFSIGTFSQKKKTTKKKTVSTNITKKKKSSTAKKTVNENPVPKIVVDQKENTENQVYNTVDTSPVPPGGLMAFRRKITTSFKIPETSENTMATVIVTFAVLEDGSLSEFKILKETPANLGLGEEAIRVIKLGGKWTPGMKDGKKVKTFYTLPIKIEIHDSE